MASIPSYYYIYDNFEILGFTQDKNELILIYHEQSNSITILFTHTLYSQDHRHLIKPGINTVLTIWYIILLFVFT